MRLKMRSRVDFPQPDGPMKAVTQCALRSTDMFRSAIASP